MRSHFEYTTSQEMELRIREIDLRSSTFMRPQTIVHDPIFTPLFFSLGLTGTIGGVSIAAIASSVLVSGLSYAVQLLLTPTEAPPKVENGRQAATQAIPYRYWGVGRTRIAGALMLFESMGNQLFSVQAIAGHKIKSFNRYYLHDDEVTLSGSSVVGLSDGRYSGQVSLFTRLGADPETPYTEISSQLASSGLWTSNHRGDGQASVAMVAYSPQAKDYQTRFPYGPPRVSVEADMALCWDYRNPSQDPDDPSTWTWTQNSALIMCWHQCFNEFGHLRDYRKAILPVLDMWIEEANICDENVPKASGGTEKRYQCNGWATSESDPKVGTNAIMATCDGWIAERGDGALLFTVGKYREDRVSVLTDADIVGHFIQYDVSQEDEINRLVPKFTYPETAYSTSDTDYFEDTSAQIVSGRILSREASYQWCTQWRQARRLGKRDWLRLQEKIRGSLDVRLSGINAIFTRWIRLETPNRIPTLNGALLENRRSVLNLGRGGFTVEFMKHPTDIDAWVPNVDEGSQPPVPGSPNLDGVTTPTVTSVIAVSTNGSVYIRTVMDAPSDTSLSTSVRYRVKDTGGGVPGAWIEQGFSGLVPSGGSLTANTNAVPVDTILQVQAAFLSSSGKYSQWSVTQEVLSLADSVSPGDATSVSATDGVGEVMINWTSPNSSNYSGAKIYIGNSSTFSSAIYQGTEYGPANTSDYTVISGLPAGTKYGWVVAINRSGTPANPVATGPFTVT